MLRFDDRVAIITGAGRGIGRQHALLLASRGATVVVNDYGSNFTGTTGNDPTPAESVVAEIKSAGGRAIAAVCDIGNAQQVKEMVRSTVEKFGRVDTLIHNASVFAPRSPFEEAGDDDLERIMRVNVTGGWNVAKAVWPIMQKQQFGRIAITGSGAGFFGRRQDHAYSIAKAALVGMAKLLATEGESHGIKTNIVGPISFTENAAKAGIPPIMEKFAPPIMVSNLFAVLSHEQCPVNGEMFHCGGGYIARVFTGKTSGIGFTLDDMSPETVLERMDEILAIDGYTIPANSDRAGADVSRTIASLNPEFAEILAEAKRARAAK